MTTITDKDWLAVPHHVRALYIKHAGEAKDIFDGKRKIPLIVTDVGPIVIHKEAGWPFTQMNKAWDTTSRAIGGPNALTSALLGGALTAGAGYGGGWLLEKLFPKKYMKRGPLRRNMAIAGGLLGGLGAGYLYGKPLVKEHGPKGVLMAGPVAAKPPKPEFWDRNYDMSKHVYEGIPVEASDQFLKHAADKLGVVFEEDDLYKKASSNVSNIMLPRMQKDPFNQMIISDPYTSMAIKAKTIGMIEAASQAKGGATWISPFDIARIAVGMGSGAVSGMLVGKTLGALAGITPEAQQGLQRAGILAGLLTNIVPQAFG